VTNFDNLYPGTRKCSAKSYVESNPRQSFFMLSPFHYMFFVSQKTARVLVVVLCKKKKRLEDHVL